MTRKNIPPAMGFLGLILLLAVSLFAFWDSLSPQHKILGISKILTIAIPDHSSMTYYENTYGDSFDDSHGDGETNAEIHLPKGTTREKLGIIAGKSGWNSLPMPKDLSILIFGDQSYEYGNAQIRKAKQVKKGFYYYLDRAQEDAGVRNEPLLSRFSYDFTFALYDPEKQILYFYQYDS